MRTSLFSTVKIYDMTGKKNSRAAIHVARQERGEGTTRRAIS